MIKTLLLIISFLTLTSAHAHEGHEHGPSQVQAPKGGILRSLETVHLELLSKGNTIRIYTYNTDLKPVEVKKFPVSATVALPKKESTPLPLADNGDHWVAEFDPKGAHRYTIELSITQGGHDDKVQFTVEPKK